jgi:hypothetical protein
VSIVVGSCGATNCANRADEQSSTTSTAPATAMRWLMKRRAIICA